MTFVEKHADQELMMREIERSNASLEKQVIFSFGFRADLGVQDERKKRDGDRMGIKKKVAGRVCSFFSLPKGFLVEAWMFQSTHLDVSHGLLNTDVYILQQYICVNVSMFALWQIC